MSFLRRLPGATPPAAPDILLAVEHDGVLYTLQRQPAFGGLALSEREREISRLVARGFSNKQIAAELGISINTVSTHMRRMFRKLGVASRAALVASAVDAAREAGV